MPGISSMPVIDSKTWCAKSDPRHVELARADRRHLPVEHRDRLEVRVHHVADPGVAPAQDGLVGLGQVGLEPGERRARPAASGRCRGRRSRTTRWCGRGSSPSSVAPSWCGGRGSRRSVAASGIACSWASTSSARVLQAALVLGGRVVQPVVAEVVGQHVLRHDPVDAVHQEERRAEHLAGRLHPAHGRHGHVGLLGDDPHRVVLVLERVVGEDRQVLGRRRDARDVLADACLAVLGPGDVEDDRLRRHAVGVDAAVQRDDRVGARRAAPWPATRPVGRAACVASRLERCIFMSAGGGACVTCPSQDLACDLDLTRPRPASVERVLVVNGWAWVSPAARGNLHDTP